MPALRKFRPGIFLIGSIFIITGLSFFYSKFSNQVPKQFEEPAFLNARWGMSQTQLERANGRKLRPAVSHRKFYSVKKGVLDKTRYKALREDAGRSFLGREAEITYIFFDDRFFSYHVFTRDRDASTLDRDMRKFLFGRFGETFQSVENGRPLKMIWNQKDAIVNYWFSEVDLNLGEKYTAGYGVVYRPIEEAIPG